jgi:hypothetical protein
MKNPHEVLRQKEMDLARLRREVEALRRVAPLLVDRSDQFGDPPGMVRSAVPAPENRWPLEVEEPSQGSAGL